MSGDNF